MHINTIIQYTNKQKLGQKMFLSSKEKVFLHDKAEISGRKV